MSDIDWIMKRKSVRNYQTDRHVLDEDIQKILQAAMAAPSAVNQQLWEFIVIDEADILKRLGAELPYAKMLLHAPAAIVVCGNLDKTYDGRRESPYWIMDCSAASENILLAVEALGLGAVWTAVYPDEKRIASVRSALKLPDAVIPLNVIPIGYAAKEEKAKDKWKPEVIHRNRW